MAGTRTTPPPMPRRPTSTPTQSPSRRTMNVMASGARCAYWPSKSNQAVLFSSVRALAATSDQETVTLEDAALLSFARNLLYLVVFVTSACGPLAPVREPAARHPRKRESLGSRQAGVRNKEECDGTHAT